MRVEQIRTLNPCKDRENTLIERVETQKNTSKQRGRDSGKQN